MSGAYVAKTFAVVGVPPGWPPNNTHVPGGTYPPISSVPPGSFPFYPYPGEPGVPGGPDPFFPSPPFPFPPGYEPEYSMIMTTGSAVDINGVLTVTNSLRDHSSYPTPEPSSVSWTATINNSPVRLKFSDEEFDSSIEKNTSFSDFWEAEAFIVFELDSGDLGKYILLTSETTVEEETVTITSFILIGTIYSATLNASWGVPTNLADWVGSYPKTFWRINIEIDSEETFPAFHSSNFKKISSTSFRWFTDETNSAGIAVSGTDYSMTAEMFNLRVINPVSFTIGASILNPLASGSCSITLVVRGNTTVVSSAGLSFSSGSHEPWVTIDVTNGSIIVNNP